MNQIANRQAICQVLCRAAKEDASVTVLCSDSRGSASLTPFAEQFPGQFVEAGIAEQDLVSIAAGLAKCGKRAFAASPACFLSSRSLEQAKIDVAYSDTNVKLIGISGGISYGALGMSHHSAQDIAAMASIPNMRVYLPCDRHETACLMEALLRDEKPAYIRVGRNAVEDVYQEGGTPFELDRANVLEQPGNPGGEVLLVACGELVGPALGAAGLLNEAGIGARVIDMYCVKPLDRETLLREARQAKIVVTAEEHSLFGGLGSMVSQAVGESCPRPVVNLGLADEPAVAGTSREVFAYYGLSAKGIKDRAIQALRQWERGN